jgi:hypothetical protein
MNIQYKEEIPGDFAGDSRVWIYQANRAFTPAEALQIEEKLKAFVGEWRSHGTPVKGYARLFFGQFIILMADESATGVSGCSTDTSVRLIKEIEKFSGVSLFDRLCLAFRKDEKVQLIPLSQLAQALKNGSVGPETLYFNNTVLTKQEWETQWMIPLKDSWLASRFLRVQGA